MARAQLLRVGRGGERDCGGRDGGSDPVGGDGIGIRLHPRGLMNPGLVVKLRPAGPWRIGPDSGARNAVDVIFHSDSLYSAVTSAMALLGSLDEWLDATARTDAPAVCFSSCYPFLDEIGFVIPPR